MQQLYQYPPAEEKKEKTFGLSAFLTARFKSLRFVVLVYTLAELGAVVHALVVVFVLGAEVGVVVVAQRVAGVPAVVGDEEPVAVHLVAQREEVVLGVTGLTLPILKNTPNLYHV